MLGDGRSVREIREMAAAAGFPLTHPQAATMLSERAGLLYRGAIVWGDLRNDDAHPAILTRREFERGITAHRPRNGKRPKFVRS
jgi:hypothetical protein